MSLPSCYMSKLNDSYSFLLFSFAIVQVVQDFTQGGLKTLTLPTYLMTLMAFYFSPIDIPIEKGGKHYCTLEQMQFPYALDITVYCTYILTDFARKFINSICDSEEFNKNRSYDQSPNSPLLL